MPIMDYIRMLLLVAAILAAGFLIIHFLGGRIGGTSSTSKSAKKVTLDDSRYMRDGDNFDM